MIHGRTSLTDSNVWLDAEADFWLGAGLDGAGEEPGRALPAFRAAVFGGQRRC